MMGERKATMTTTTTKSSFTGAPPPPQPEAEHLPCPRCGSANTKFCYYNNYNFSQPRHFCKSCRRYWTHGGTLRDIPVGGGSRKNGKRSRTSAAAAAAAACPAVGFVPEAHQPNNLGLAMAFPFDGTVCGSFTSLLGGGGGGGGSVHGQGGGGLLGLAGGFGLEDVAGFEPGRGGVWHFPGEPSNGPGFGVGGPNTWQLDSGGDGFGGVDGGDSCFADDLAISTPGSFMKRSEDY